MVNYIIPSAIDTYTSDYQIADDWGDNLLSGRSNSGQKLIALPTDPTVMVRCESFRPVWTILTGTPTATGGQLVLGSTPDSVSCPSTIVTGTWTCKVALTSTASGSFALRFLYQDTNNYYQLLLAATGPFNLIKDDAGTTTTIITATWTPDTSVHTITATRDASGNFEIFLDGTSMGTVTDAFLPTVANIVLYNSSPTADVSGIEVI